MVGISCPGPRNSVRLGCLRPQCSRVDRSCAWRWPRASCRDGERVSGTGSRHPPTPDRGSSGRLDTVNAGGDAGGCMNGVACGNSTRGGVILYSGRHATCFCMPGWLRWAHIAGHSDVRISQCPHITSTDFPEGQFWKWIRASCRDAYFKSHFLQMMANLNCRGSWPGIPLRSPDVSAPGTFPLDPRRCRFSIWTKPET